MTTKQKSIGVPAVRPLRHAVKAIKFGNPAKRRKALARASRLVARYSSFSVEQARTQLAILDAKQKPAQHSDTNLA